MNTTAPSATRGKFGSYGGQFVPEVLMPALIELETAYAQVQGDPVFEAEFQHLLRTYVGRPTPLTFAGRLTDYLTFLGGATWRMLRQPRPDVVISLSTPPLVAALGIGLASSIRGRDPLVDGFGLIAFASLTPMIFVMAYGMMF